MAASGDALHRWHTRVKHDDMQQPFAAGVGFSEQALNAWLRQIVGARRRRCIERRLRADKTANA